MLETPLIAVYEERLSKPWITKTDGPTEAHYGVKRRDDGVPAPYGTPCWVQHGRDEIPCFELRLLAERALDDMVDGPFKSSLPAQARNRVHQHAHRRFLCYQKPSPSFHSLKPAQPISTRLPINSFTLPILENAQQSAIPMKLSPIRRFDVIY